MSTKKPSLASVLNTIGHVADTAQALDSASNLVRSVTSLRRRAKEHEQKARSARTNIGRVWHLWRADRLNDRAADIERDNT
jgi:hypothetical protein